MDTLFFRASHLLALALLQGGNKAGGFQQAVVCARVKPGIAPAHGLLAVLRNHTSPDPSQIVRHC